MAGFPRAGDEYASRYLVVRELGHGASGIVYEAVDNVLNRPVALKIVLPSLSDRGEHETRFAREAAVLSTIRSRHVVSIAQHGAHDDTVYVVTELFPDGDLQSWLADQGPLDRRSALVLVAQVCEALADAHATGVIHRDVKPGNVLLRNRPEGLVPHLGDFGVVVDDRKGLTGTGALAGSPAYMAPERHFGHAADERGDIYSVGCLLWAVLTGSTPYSGTDFQMMNAHINEPAPQLGTGLPLDTRIDELLADLMAKDPERRPASARDVRQRLLGLVGEVDAQVSGAAPMIETVTIRDTTPRSAPAPSHRLVDAPDGRRRRGVWLFGPVLVLVLAGGIAAAMGLSGDEPEPTPSVPDTTVLGAEATATGDAGRPSTPQRPRVSARSDYRAVTFAVTPARDGDRTLAVEYDVGDGWQPAGPTVTIETAVGGDEQCVRFRSLGPEQPRGRSVSRTVRRCATAAPPTVEFIRSEDPCVNSIGGPCTWYDVAVTGFESNSSPLVNVRRVDGLPWCEECDYDRIEVGADGRGYLTHDWKISRDEGQVILDVAGVTGEFHVFH